MNFEPQKFFVGLIDFFSVLLPGSIVAFLLNASGAPAPLLDALRSMEGSKGVAAFLVASYLLGHFIFLLGAWLDDAYDAARRVSRAVQIRRLAFRGRLTPRWQRALLWLAFRGEDDGAVNRAAEIKASFLDRLHARTTVNTFQWAKLHLSSEWPDALAVVQRFEADQKFFRSLSVVLLLVLLLAVGSVAVMALDGRDQPPVVWRQVITAIVLAVPLLILALWRYAEQRMKATRQAYWAVISLEARLARIALPARAPRPDQPTHAGGIVYRTTERGVQYLLVEAKNDPRTWVLPKGHIERGEHPRVTAVREVLEETGVWAGIRGDGLDPIAYTGNGEEIRARYFLMEFLEQGRPADPDREHTWMGKDAAVAALLEPSAGLILRAESARLAPPARSSHQVQV